MRGDAFQAGVARGGSVQRHALWQHSVSLFFEIDSNEAAMCLVAPSVQVLGYGGGHVATLARRA